jgi:hypothetical protein
VELGQPLNESPAIKSREKYMHNAFWISFWMVIAVPGGSISAAAAAADKTQQQPALAYVIWGIAGATSIAAVGCATVLMLYSRSGRGLDQTPETPWDAPRKPLA